MPERKAGSITGMGVRGQVSGLVHRNKSDDSSTHVARPINSLTDPSTFAPPPTRRGTGLAAAPAPTSEKRTVVAAPSRYQDPRGPKVAPPPKVSSSPQPQQQQQIGYQRQDSGLSVGSGRGTGSPAQHGYGDPEEEEAVPRGPYRANTTGLSTDHLPKPPGRRDGANGMSPPPVPPPPSYNTALSHPQQPPPTAAMKPSLPPRLPARTNAGGTPPPPPPQSRRPAAPEPSSNMLNQGAIARLGNAGVSVPGLGIGGGSGASPSPPPPPRQPSAGGGAHLGELQNRFSKLNTSTSSESPPAGGTTWAQKQAALKTASAMHKDPSSISVGDARAAAGVAGNFQQRHGEQVASLNQKYGVANKIGGLVGGSGSQQGSTAMSTPASPVSGFAGKKKPPPPPPKKKPGLGGGAAPLPTREEEDVPPPIPLATRPTF